MYTVYTGRRGIPTWVYREAGIPTWVYREAYIPGYTLSWEAYIPGYTLSWEVYQVISTLGGIPGYTHPGRHIPPSGYYSRFTVGQ